MHASGLSRLAAGRTRGQGVILTLHHVLPEAPPEFAPNALLAVTPHFLELAIETVRREGFEIVSLDEAARRIESGDQGAPFAVFTFDDAYRDVRDHALPVLRRQDCPATIFVVSSFASGRGFLWWRALEFAIRHQEVLTVDLGSGEERIEARTASQKTAAWNRIYWALRAGGEGALRAAVADLAMRAGYDAEADCREVCMDWDELREVARDPLVTIGAHTVRHYMLAKWPEDVMRSEICDNRTDIDRELGMRVEHLAYPVGDPTSADRREFDAAAALGFRTAVTTRPDHIRPRHRSAMTGLPRVSLNGLFQRKDNLEVLLSGLPFAARNLLRR
jgi:peptidoglycan/xylan/chitin deacetylase (PgdA/CDA1 family)